MADESTTESESNDTASSDLPKPMIEVLDRVKFRGNKFPRTGKICQIFFLLALSADEQVSIEKIVEELWGDEPPGSFLYTMQTYVLRMRNIDGLRELIVTCNQGYRLEVEPMEVDALRFMAYVSQAQALFMQGRRVEEALRILESARALVRGPALTEVDCGCHLALWKSKIEDCRKTAELLRIDIELRRGNHGLVLNDIKAVWRANPLREELLRRLMVALYRCGRTMEINDCFRQTQGQLRASYGMEPGPITKDLMRRILVGDRELLKPGESIT